MWASMKFLPAKVIDTGVKKYSPLPRLEKKDTESNINIPLPTPGGGMWTILPIRYSTY